MANNGKPTLTFAGQNYLIEDLSDVAKQQIQNSRAADSEIEHLNLQRALTMTARAAYLRELFKYLPEPAAKNAKKDLISVDGVNYKKDDFNEAGQVQLANLSNVETRLNQIDGELAIAQTARAAYVTELEKALPTGNATKQ